MDTDLIVLMIWIRFIYFWDTMHFDQTNTAVINSHVRIPHSTDLSLLEFRQFRLLNCFAAHGCVTEISCAVHYG